MERVIQLLPGAGRLALPVYQTFRSGRFCLLLAGSPISTRVKLRPHQPGNRCYHHHGNKYF
jgi:hypothetical protein